MKSFFIRRDRSSKCSKKRCMDRVVWTWTYSNRTEVTCVSVRPARMQQWASKKEILVGKKN